MSDPKPTVAREVAEAEFDRWAAAMRLTRKVDASKLDDADKAALQSLKESILGAIEDAALVVDGEGRFVFTPEGNKGEVTIVFHKPTGASVMAMDQAKSGETGRRMAKFLADMTRNPVDLFAGTKLELVDLQVCDSIAQLFLAK